MSQPKSLRWTVKQKHIAELLQQGMTNAQISKKVKIDKSVVTKVKNALATGDIPENKTKMSKVLKKGSGPWPVGHNEGANVSQHAPSGQAQQHDQALQQSQATGEATLIKLVPVITTVPLTPIMLNARLYLTMKKGWRKDMPWENFFDTIIYRYFDACGIKIAPWYEEETSGRE